MLIKYDSFHKFSPFLWDFVKYAELIRTLTFFIDVILYFIGFF